MSVANVVMFEFEKSEDLENGPNGIKLMVHSLTKKLMFL